MRLAVCMGAAVDVIGPCGFILDDRRLRRAGMDYLEGIDMTVFRSWEEYRASRIDGRLALLTTKGAIPYTDFAFRSDDRIMVGQESAGVPDSVHEVVDARLVIPIKPPARSLNVALAAAIVLGEAMRQITLASRMIDSGSTLFA
ncbi:tRNA (cytidine(34)-2'-O)-methyltransferase [Azospirillaceae bacterium]